MSTDSAIEWTGPTWNPVTGCDQVSEGCGLPLSDGTPHGTCYALTLAKRLKAMGNPRYQRDGDPRTSGPGFGVTLHPDKLEEPLGWRTPRPIFVNSMSDLFHKQVPDGFIARVFAVMSQAKQHVFQILTKRPGRMASLLAKAEFREQVQVAIDELYDDPDDQVFPDDYPLPNVWLGTSVESQKWADVRIPKLLETPAAVRFLSCEPLLGGVDLDQYLFSFCRREDGNCPRAQGTGSCPDCLPARQDLHWIIVGGESGPGFLPMNLDWARKLRNQSIAAGVAFFFKQVGGRTPKAGGNELDGRVWKELPPTTPEGILAYLRGKSSA